ncbi:Bug family tripartite tricarboxylate transporter substrate binding protein [Paraburkholderia fungorum]|uniref:Bug family tripartite tricarboxylate transporter substrate binding protein n=1 Tax=Paraburkholderia fungorum TaxID=134537 RepID=UPI002097CAB6|nr:tripartite tricarboxylate transporter substrate binding protein [Paraburkholderia fungorum]USX06796.1 tripartite tricarboxylate transporter substrate binding protein [Paraburkholderia fungorum]
MKFSMPHLFLWHVTLRSLVTRGAALSALLAAAAMLLAPVQARAEGSVIRFIVPFAAGSYTDNVARILAPAVAQRLNASIIVENRPGANGIIGADYVSRSKPDGLTLLVGSASVNAINPAVYKSLPYDPVRDLVPVVRLGVLPFLVVTNPSVPANNIAELVAYAKKKPGTVSCATPNSSTLVGIETFKRIAGVDILTVPYKSSQQAMTDLIGNQVQMMIADFASGMPMVRSGKVRLLAVSMGRRSSLLPDTPTVNETIKGFDLTAWTGLLAPHGTPPAIVSRVYAAVGAALATPDLQAKLKLIGFDVQPLGPAQFGSYMQADVATWGRLAKEAGIKPQ